MPSQTHCIWCGQQLGNPLVCPHCRQRVCSQRCLFSHQKSKHWYGERLLVWFGFAFIILAPVICGLAWTFREWRDAQAATTTPATTHHR